MEYQAIKNSIHANPTLLFRELLKYDRENLSSLILKNDSGISFIKEFVSKNKHNLHYSTNEHAVSELLTLCFELGYDPMRPAIYNPYLSEWGKRENDNYTEKYPEITCLWFDLSDTNQSLVLEHIGKENLQNLVSKKYHFLHHAFKQNHYKTIETLNSFGLDYNAKDNFGKSVKDYAENNPRALDLYLKLNTNVSDEQKFQNLKKWFSENIKDIGTSKYLKAQSVKNINLWLNQKWPTFSLKQKQEIFSLSIGSSTKDIFSSILTLEEDKKILVSPQTPFWTSLDNCKVKQLAFNSIKNVKLDEYNKEINVYFIEKLALMFKNFDLQLALSMPNPKDDYARIKELGKSYANYKDIWLLKAEDNDPFFHTMAKRKNEVFNIFGNNWLKIDSTKDLMGITNSNNSYLIDDNTYTVKRFDNQGKQLNVVKISVTPLAQLDLMKSTWLYKDKEDKYTFEYFMENHYESITPYFQPQIFEKLKDLMKDYYFYDSTKKTLTEEKKVQLENHYTKNIEPIYPIEAVFKLLLSCSVVYEKMSAYNTYGLDSRQVSDAMRNCYNIISTSQHKDHFNYSGIKIDKKLNDIDPSLFHDLGALILKDKLSHDLSDRIKTKQLKI